jgi:hypothetical protein
MRKRKLALVLPGILCLSLGAFAATEPPKGDLLELHSCELYAGGCIVSSEATLDGRYMLRAWSFTGGAFSGTELAGLKLALVQSSSENLAAEKAQPGKGVVYLPEDATAKQRQALLAWVKSTQPGLSGQLQTRVAPLQFAKTEDGYSFSAGDLLSVKVSSREPCEAGCGESLWYSPRTPTSVFTVAVDKASRIKEPLLALKWIDAGKRNVFLGKFGENPREVYVTAADLCGPSSKLF